MCLFTSIYAIFLISLSQAHGSHRREMAFAEVSRYSRLFPKTAFAPLSVRLSNHDTNLNTLFDAEVVAMQESVGCC